MTVSRGIISDTERRSWSARLLLTFFGIVLIAVSLMMVFPLFFAFSAGLKSTTDVFKAGVFWPADPLWGNYQEAWERLNMVNMFKNSLIVGIGVVISRLLVCSMAAYSLSRLQPKGKKVVEALILMTMTLPAIATLVPLYMTLVNPPFTDISLLNNYFGLWLPYSANALTILIMKNSFDQIPKDIYDAATIDGASEVPLFFQFTLPLSKSILIILALSTFISMWGDFLLPQLILRNPEMQTVSVRFFTMTREFPINLFMAGSFIAMLPPTIIAIFLQRYIKGGLTF